MLAVKNIAHFIVERKIIEYMELGNNTDYSAIYDASILAPVQRIKYIDYKIYGYDIWTCYELSWLNIKGKPICAILTLFIPCDSKFIVESKSLKLYLNSFNNQSYDSANALKDKIKQDIENIVLSSIELSINSLEEFDFISQLPGANLDDLDIECKNYQPDDALLKVEAGDYSDECHTHLFRSNCKVTNQPDYASMYFKYNAHKQLHRSSLLQYLVSYRNHVGFHEECVDRIFYDLFNILTPQSLLIYARFTRRGGIDINPVRANYQISINDINIYPLIRQ